MCVKRFCWLFFFFYVTRWSSSVCTQGSFCERYFIWIPKERSQRTGSEHYCVHVCVITRSNFCFMVQEKLSLYSLQVQGEILPQLRGVASLTSLKLAFLLFQNIFYICWIKLFFNQVMLPRSALQGSCEMFPIHTVVYPQKEVAHSPQISSIPNLISQKQFDSPSLCRDP